MADQNLINRNRWFGHYNPQLTRLLPSETSMDLLTRVIQHPINSPTDAKMVIGGMAQALPSFERVKGGIDSNNLGFEIKDIGNFGFDGTLFTLSPGFRVVDYFRNFVSVFAEAVDRPEGVELPSHPTGETREEIHAALKRHLLWTFALNDTFVYQVAGELMSLGIHLIDADKRSVFLTNLDYPRFLFLKKFGLEGLAERFPDYLEILPEAHGAMLKAMIEKQTDELMAGGVILASGQKWNPPALGPQPDLPRSHVDRIVEGSRMSAAFQSLIEQPTSQSEMDALLSSVEEHQQVANEAPHTLNRQQLEIRLTKQLRDLHEVRGTMENLSDSPIGLKIALNPNSPRSVRGPIVAEIMKTAGETTRAIDNRGQLKGRFACVITPKEKNIQDPIEIIPMHFSMEFGELEIEVVKTQAQLIALKHGGRIETMEVLNKDVNREPKTRLSPIGNVQSWQQVLAKATKLYETGCVHGFSAVHPEEIKKGRWIAMPLNPPTLSLLATSCNALYPTESIALYINETWTPDKSIKKVLVAAYQPKGSQTPEAPQGPVGRNDPCPCGSGKKFKKCHM